jgi:hypothetical protein
MKKYPFYTVLTYLNDMYGVEMPDDIFETMAFVAWNKIGNRDSKIYLSQETPVKEESGEWSVNIPCNADYIESVTTNYEDYQKTSNTVNYPNMSSLPYENYNEYFKYGTNELYQYGKMVKYRELGDKLYFTGEYDKINILYKGTHVDDEGLPYLNDKEVDAIAMYCLFSDTYKKGIRTKDAGTIQLAQVQKQEWLRACNAARIPKLINQNEMNEVLNAKTSWNRKMFGKSFKPIT